MVRRHDEGRVVVLLLAHVHDVDRRRRLSFSSNSIRRMKAPPSLSGRDPGEAGRHMKERSFRGRRGRNREGQQLITWLDDASADSRGRGRGSSSTRN